MVETTPKGENMTSVDANSRVTGRPSEDLVRRLAGPSDDEIAVLDAWWRANNYLTIGQIYLMANPLLREPLRAEHIKPRLLGHWGTSPGLSFIYAHASRLIRETGQEMIYLAGPGHGGPALVAAGYLEGTYSEIYPDVGRGRGRAGGGCSASSRRRAASPATCR